MEAGVGGAEGGKGGVAEAVAVVALTLGLVVAVEMAGALPALCTSPAKCAKDKRASGTAISTSRDVATTAFAGARAASRQSYVLTVAYDWQPSFSPSQGVSSTAPTASLQTVPMSVRR